MNRLNDYLQHWRDRRLDSPIPGDLLYFVATVHRYPMIPRTPARWGLRCPTNVIVQPQTRGRR